MKAGRRQACSRHGQRYVRGTVTGLPVADASAADGAGLIQWPVAGGANQGWQLVAL